MSKGNMNVSTRDGQEARVDGTKKQKLQFIAEQPAWT